MLRRFPVVLVLILFDLWLLWGPIIQSQSIVNLTQYILDSTHEWNGFNPQTTQDAVVFVQNADARRFGLVGAYMPTLSLTADVAPQTSATWSLDSGWLLGAVIMGMHILVLLVSVLVAQPLAESIAGRAGWGWQRLGRSMWNLFRVMLIIGLLLLTLSVPLLLSMLVLIASSPLAFQLGILFLVVWFIVVWIMCSFSIEATLVGGVSPLVALYQSYHLVRTQLRGIILLDVAQWTLILGFGFILQPLFDSTSGTLGAVVVYAVLSSSLVAARMVFYRDRVALLKHTVPVSFAHE